MSIFAWWSGYKQFIASLVPRMSRKGPLLEPYTTPEDQQFIDYLNSYPEDDISRLIFADWLEDQNRPIRAALLRSQVANLHPTSLPIPQTAQHWLKTLPFVEGVEWIGFERGSARAKVSGLKPLAELASHEEIDCLIHLELQAKQYEPFELVPAAQRGYLNRVDSMAVFGMPALHESLYTLLNSPKAPLLRTLQIQAWNFSDHHANRLAQSTALRDLRRLEISHGRLSGEGVAALLCSSILQQVTSLKLCNHPIGAGIRCLMNISALSRMESISLDSLKLFSDSQATAQILRRLTRASHLSLTGNHLELEVVHAIANPDGCVPLRSLNISGNQLGDDGIAVLANSERLRGIEELNLRRTDAGDSAAIALSKSPHLSSISRLDLGENRIHSDGFTALINSPMLKQVKWLNLTGNPAPYDLPPYPWCWLWRRVYL